jgi:hypothetical protein
MASSHPTHWTGIGVRTCLLPVLQADSQRGGVAPTVSTAGFPDSTVRESREASSPRRCTAGRIQVKPYFNGRAIAPEPVSFIITHVIVD